jgi:DNA-binding transcriptional MocR family regulator
MQSWLDAIAGHGGPKYLAIADAIDHAVRTGALRPGERLPPQRALAVDLGVDLTTVTRAYGLARDAGLIEGSGRLGSFVRNAAGLPPADLTGDSGMIMPPQPGFARLSDAMRDGLTRLLHAGGQSPLLQYQPSGGAVRDRQEAARAFSGRGLATREDQTVITAGGQHALHAIIGTLFQPGDIVCAGRSTYPGLIALARRFALKLVAIPGDADGLDPDAVQSAALAGAKAVYVVPTNDNPTTATLDIERRLWLAAIARRHGLILIEDDAYGQLPEKPLPPLAAFAPEISWHIASLSKIVSPVLRVAHVRAPSADAARLLADDLHETSVMAPPLNAALATYWLREGIFADLVAGVRAEGVARQRRIASLLAGLDHASHPEGYHLWLRLPADATAPADLAARLGPLGLSIVAGERFAVDPEAPERAIRISIGGAIGHERLTRAFEGLRALLRA